MRKTGIEIIGDCPWGSHFCQFYQTPQDLADILVPYIKAGLEGNECCVWITSPPFTTAEAERALREEMPEFEVCRQRGQIEILSHTDWYLKGGNFSMERVLDAWQAKLEDAIAMGFDGLRVTGNTAWLEKKDWRAFTDYEDAINSVAANSRLIVLCTYSLDRCSAHEILDVVRSHQFALIKSTKGWELLQSQDARKAKEEQRESEERYRELFTAMSEGFALHQILCDDHGKPADYRFLEVNPAFERLTGMARDKILGRTVREVLPDIEPFWIETYGKVALTGEPVRFESHSGSLGRDFEVFAYCPAQWQFACLIVDTTERKDREKVLEASEARYRNLVDLSPEGVFINRDDRIVFANSSALRLFGASGPDQVLGRSLFDFFHPDFHGSIGERLVQLRAGKQVPLIEEKVVRLDGTIADVEAAASPFADQDGPAIQVIMRDVTERKRAWERLDLLAETAGRLLGSDSPQRVIDSLCGRVMAFLDCQVFFNYLIDEQRHCLRLHASSGIPEEEVRRIERLEYGAAVCGVVARDGCRVVCEHIQETPDPRTDLVRPFGVRAYACHPLISQGYALGTLSFGTCTRDRFTDEELSLMKAVADQVAIALERMRAQKALQQANERLERRVAERTEELRAANEALLAEIAERRKSQDALREQARFLEEYFEHAINPLVFLDRTFHFIRVNQAYARACQRDMSEFPGHNHFEFYPNKENQAIFEEVVRSKTPNVVSSKPLVFPDHPEWGVTYWDWALVPVLDARGEVDFLFLSMRDVTKDRRAEADAQAASQYSRSLIEASLDPLVTISPAGKITDVNEATELATGMSRNLLIGQNFSDYFTEPDKANEGYQKVISEGFVKDYPLTMRHVSGRTTDVLYNAAVYRNEAGQVQGVFAAARDVTELKAAQKRRDLTNALLELFATKSSSQEYLDSVVESIRAWSGCQALGIRIVDEDRKIPYAACAGFDEEFLRLENSLSLENDRCVCVRTVVQSDQCRKRALVTAGGSFRCDDASDFYSRLPAEEMDCYRGNCAKFGFASLAVIPLRYRDEVIGAIHMADRRKARFPSPVVEFIESMAPLVGEAIQRFRAEAELNRYQHHLEELVRQRTNEMEAANAQLHSEVAERRRAEETLRRTAAELARSNRDLEQFAYVASHDLQEPLRAVTGYVELLRQRFPDKLDDKALQFIAGATDGAARMQKLIIDLLAVSRVGTQKKSLEPTDLAASLQTALRSLRIGIEEAGAKITSDPLPALAADATQITQVFQNLIANAIRFRSERPLQIHVGARKEAGRWLLSVRDNGIGFDPQYADRIFLIFQRLHTRRQFPGTGVGLAICKRIVERHGGAIWAESQPDQGSTFYFTLPERNENPS